MEKPKQIVIKGKTEWEKNVMKSLGPLIVVFHAAWARPCKAALSWFPEYVRKAEGKWTLVLVDTDVEENEALAQSQEINFLPTIFEVQEGKIINKISGWNRFELETILAKYT